MKIDHKATREKYMRYRLQNVASRCSVAPAIVTAVLDGYYKQMNSPSAQKVIAELRELGVLVEVDDDVDLQDAA